MKPGDVVSGRYNVVRHIGRGGMQDVYLARDTLLEIDVAVKTPQPGQQVKRFSKSAVIAARVNHHNVAKTYDYFEEGGQPFWSKSMSKGKHWRRSSLGSEPWIRIWELASSVIWQKA